MNELRVLSTLLDNPLNVKFWLLYEVVDGLNAAKYTVLILVLIDTEVWFTRN